MTALKAGAAYFATVFVAGFILGALRVSILEPFAGDLAAVIIELPIILIVSWFLCSYIIRKLSVPHIVGARLLMGLIAFALLMAAEFTLARYGFNRTPFEQLQEWVTPAGAAGLAGQVAFALFPLAQRFKREPQ